MEYTTSVKECAFIIKGRNTAEVIYEWQLEYSIEYQCVEHARYWKLEKYFDHLFASRWWHCQELFFHPWRDKLNMQNLN